MSGGLPATELKDWYGLSPYPVGPSGSTCHTRWPAACRKSSQRCASGPSSPMPYLPGNELGCSRMPARRLSPATKLLRPSASLMRTAHLLLEGRAQRLGCGGTTDEASQHQQCQDVRYRLHDRRWQQRSAAKRLGCRLEHPEQGGGAKHAQRMPLAEDQCGQRDVTPAA